MTSSQHDAYAWGHTHPTMGSNNRSPTRKGEPILQTFPQFRLRAATRPHEVGIGSNRGSAGRGEYVLAPCTHFNITRLAVNLSTWCKSMLVVKKIWQS